ncbi:hypothetical protein [Spirochaeta thermophila]|uniref:Lipoprotein n=1 Tax=Winmispira thermophila (strain ATCC 49972 / DSM 6192 / RI 19.B1) TaxID=665571 RepID=E0RRE8_WINT6|nr:hypothetical protein [Spirochaeta thermophila]ADN01649.1 hypothetical protein STHERM_c06910 [Spirochaeta thermophila DSM 6192]
MNHVSKLFFRLVVVTVSIMIIGCSNNNVKRIEYSFKQVNGLKDEDVVIELAEEDKNGISVNINFKRKEIPFTYDIVFGDAGIYAVDVLCEGRLKGGKVEVILSYSGSGKVVWQKEIVPGRVNIKSSQIDFYSNELTVLLEFREAIEGTLKIIITPCSI